MRCCLFYLLLLQYRTTFMVLTKDTILLAVFLRIPPGLIASKYCIYLWLQSASTTSQLRKAYASIRLRLKCDGTRAENRFPLSAKRTSPFKSAGRGGGSVQSTTGSRGGRISGSNAGYTMFRGSVKGTGYPLNSKVSPSLPLLCVTVCHHVSTGLYKMTGYE